MLLLRTSPSKQTSSEFRLFARGEFSRSLSSFNMHSFGFETSRHTHTIGATMHEQCRYFLTFRLFGLYDLETRNVFFFQSFFFNL